MQATFSFAAVKAMASSWFSPLSDAPQITNYYSIYGPTSSDAELITVVTVRHQPDLHNVLPPYVLMIA